MAMRIEAQMVQRGRYLAVPPPIHLHTRALWMAAKVRSARRNVLRMATNRGLYIDFSLSMTYLIDQPCSSRGVSGGDPEGGARRGVLRRRLATVSLGRHGNRPPGTMTRAARSSLYGPRRKCRGRKRGSGARKIATVERREASVPGTRDAPRLASVVMTCAPVGAPPPLDRGGQGQGSGAIASRERDGLFDIVRRNFRMNAHAGRR